MSLTPDSDFQAGVEISRFGIPIPVTHKPRLDFGGHDAKTWAKFRSLAWVLFRPSAQNYESAVRFSSADRPWTYQITLARP